MSANLAVINFSVGGTLVVSGKTTLSETIKSSSSGDFQGLTSTTLAVSGISTFYGSLPTSSQTPTSNSQLTTKVYVDTADGVLDTRITSVDSSRKTYVDTADGVLDTRITSVDSSRKTYVVTADGVLNTRITFVDSARKTYIDDADGVLNTRITSVDSARKTYIDASYGVLNTKIDSIRTNFDVFYYIINGSNQSFGSSGTSVITLNGVGIQVVKISSSAYDSQYSIYTSTGGTFYFYANATISNERYGYIAIFKNGVMALQGGIFSYPAIQTNVFASVAGLLTTVNGDSITVVFGHLESSQIKGNTITEFGGYRVK